MHKDIIEKDIREQKVKDAIAISMLDAGEPTAEAKKLAEDYINGDLEAHELKALVLEMYKEGNKE